MMFFKRELNPENILLTTLKSFETIVFFAPNHPSDLKAFRLNLACFHSKNL
jgi:hypothetical protein